MVLKAINGMKFTVHNKQAAVPIDETFWNRAFDYASRELQIEHHCAKVDCFFIPLGHGESG
jgi:hypothetical protein